MFEPEAASSSSDANSEMSNNGGKMTPFLEPAKKRMRMSQAVDAAKNKLEDRLGDILCCAVCLDLPKAAVYQVRR